VQKDVRAAGLLLVALSVRALVSPADGSLPSLALYGEEFALAGGAISVAIGTVVLGWNREGIDPMEVLLLAGMAVLGSIPLRFVLPAAMVSATLLGWIMHTRGRTVTR
jgi:hypothetical protein